MKTKPQLGILGGGQLSLMLAQAALDLSVVPHVLAANTDESLRGLEGVVYYGEDKIEDFAQAIDVLCFESEFYKDQWLSKILQYKPELLLSPSQNTLERLRDKYEQKLFFEKQNLPQSRFLLLKDSDVSSQNILDQLIKNFPKGAVLKRSLGGYDGKGNFFVPSERYQQTDEAWLESLCDFVKQSHNEGAKVYAEEWIHFEQELAVVAYPVEQSVETEQSIETEQSVQAEQSVRMFPLVSTYQVNGTCKEVWGPYQHSDLEEQAYNIVKAIAQEFSDLGVFAVEFFESQGKLWINEMAPRVHNSAHYTRLWDRQSQFHAHVARVCGLDFGLNFEPAVSTQSHSSRCFLMRNILAPYTQAQALPEHAKHLFDETFEAFPDKQWYQKSYLKSGRKMGHVSLELDDIAQVLSFKKRLETLENVFWDRIAESTELME